MSGLQLPYVRGTTIFQRTNMYKIIVVDDETPIRSLLREILERAGYQVLEAADGNKALKILQDNPVDLVITDIIMPEKEGIGTIIDLRQAFPDVKIIAMSGGGHIAAENYLTLAQKLGAHRTLNKPFHKTEMLAAVEELLSDKPMDKQS